MGICGHEERSALCCRTPLDKLSLLAELEQLRKEALAANDFSSTATEFLDEILEPCRLHCKLIDWHVGLCINSNQEIAVFVCELLDTRSHRLNDILQPSSRVKADPAECRRQSSE